MSTNTSDQIDSTTATGHAGRSIFERFQRAVGPAMPGVVLDLVDALSLTRYVGPFVSFPAGAAVGIWLSSYYQISWQWKLMIVVGSGLYTLTPGTEAIPLATILTCLGRYKESGHRPLPERSAPATSADAPQRTDVVDPPPASTIAESSARGDRTGAKCPECGSSILNYGQVGQRFWPSGGSVWAKGHEVNAFVCLECGFVGHYLSTSDLEKLQRKRG